jgi:hypothetical protein
VNIKNTNFVRVQIFIKYNNLKKTYYDIIYKFIIS